VPGANEKVPFAFSVNEPPLPAIGWPLKSTRCPVTA
jgi:hypothetical protein